MIPDIDQRARASLAEAKRQLRREMQAKRAGFAAAAAGPILIERFAAIEPVQPAIAVSGFWPIGDEIDVKPLLLELDRRGHPVGLPVVVARGEPLVFRRWRPGGPLVAAPFGLSVPPADAPEVVPQLLLVPLLAFDRSGYRLGYGGGFYDRSLAKLRERQQILAVGVAYAGQEVEAVPRDETDQRLDWVLTDRQAIKIGS